MNSFKKIVLVVTLISSVYVQADWKSFIRPVLGCVVTALVIGLAYENNQLHKKMQQTNKENKELETTNKNLLFRQNDLIKYLNYMIDVYKKKKSRKVHFADDVK